MKVLLDTHTFFWFIGGDSKLSARALTVIADLDNERFMSVSSLWEIAIKTNIGKLTLQLPYEEFIPLQLLSNRIGILPIDFAHLIAVSKLPLHHRDPFDRLIIAQAMIENIALVSADSAFDAYDITRIW
jgi:PIN domain nuclease of toxin-antitoxin system